MFGPTIACNTIRAINASVAAGKPFDKLIVLANGLSGGIAALSGEGNGKILGGDTVVAGNSSSGAALHELGHSFGLIHEHFDSQAEGLATDRCESNCCMSSACVDWKNIEGAQCIKGCEYTNWYRSSKDSIMNSGEGFNIVSQHIIQKEFDEFIATDQPNVTISEPLNGAIVSGEIQFDISSTGGKRIQKVELYVDDKPYVASFTGARLLGAWDTRSLEPGSKHTLSAKAYYGTNSPAVSKPVTVTLSNPPKPYSDLTVTSLEILPKDPGKGSKMSFVAKIKNQGRLAAWNPVVTAFFLRDTSPYETLIIDPIDTDTKALNPGLTETEKWLDAWVAQPGTYKAEVCTDTTAVIGQQDANYANNCMEKVFTVSSSVVSEKSFENESFPPIDEREAVRMPKIIPGHTPSQTISPTPSNSPGPSTKITTKINDNPSISEGGIRAFVRNLNHIFQKILYYSKYFNRKGF